MTVVLFALALFVGICYIMRGEKVGFIGKYIFEGLFGVFGGSAILVPLADSQSRYFSQARR